MPKTPQGEASKANAAKVPKTKKQNHKARQSKNKAIDGHSVTSNSTAGKLSKSSQCLTLLRCGEDATIAELMAAADWQSHSVIGFLSGTVKGKLGLAVTSAAGEDGIRRYRVAGQGA